MAAELEDRPLLETSHRGLLIFGVVLVSICQFLDATIANVALPHMQAALGASNDQIAWVLTSFILATAVATPITGWLSDRFGSRRLFLTSVIVFLAASAACGASMSLPQMVVFRAIQGIAAGFIGPMTMTIMFDVSPPSKQPFTLAVFGMIVMTAPISGPFIGGFLTEYLNWRWIYYVNLPLGLPALALLWWLLPSRDVERRPLDLFGFASLALALVAFQLMLDRGQSEDWFNSWEIIVAGIVALSALWVFVVHTRSAPDPLFKRGLYTNTNFMISLGFMGVMGVAVIGLSAGLPMMYQAIYGYPVMQTGMLMAPRGIGVAITSLLSSVLIRHFDARHIIASGYLIAAFGMWYTTSWAIEMDSGPILVASFFQGLGFGLVVGPMNLIAFRTLDPSLRPDGSSLMALFRSLGGSVGVSVIFTLLSRNQQISHSDIAGNLTANSLPAVDLPAAVDRLPGIGSGMMEVLNAEVTRQALMISFLDSFYLLTFVLLAFVPLPLFMRNTKIAAPVKAPPVAE